MPPRVLNKRGRANTDEGKTLVDEKKARIALAAPSATLSATPVAPETSATADVPLAPEVVVKKKKGPKPVRTPKRRSRKPHGIGKGKGKVGVAVVVELPPMAATVAPIALEIAPKENANEKDDVIESDGSEEEELSKGSLVRRPIRRAPVARPIGDSEDSDSEMDDVDVHASIPTSTITGPVEGAAVKKGKKRRYIRSDAARERRALRRKTKLELLR